MFTIKEISELIGGKIIGESDLEITSVNNIENAGKGAISFITDEEYMKFLADSDASAFIVPDTLNIVANGKKQNFIVVDNVYKSLALLLKTVENESIEQKGINQLSYISSESKIEQVFRLELFLTFLIKLKLNLEYKIATNVFVGKNVKIGKNTLIYSGVKIYNGCIIGDNCIIHSNTVWVVMDSVLNLIKKGFLKKYPILEM